MKKVSMHHSTASFDECFAKIVLDYIEKKEYILSDKPDLILNDVGVEVVSAFPNGYHQAIHLMQDFKKIDGKLSDIGYYNNYNCPGILIHPIKEIEEGKPFPTYNYLIDAIENKKTKIVGYGNVKIINLFVLTDNLEINTKTLEVLIRKIININESKFSKIYIQYCQKIIIIDCENKKFCIKEIEQISEIVKKAIKLENETFK